MQNLQRSTAARTGKLCLLLLLLAGGCIVPPDVEQAKVLAPKELEIISLVKRGKDYSLSGRADLAEVEFRKALHLRPNEGMIYNDLGFVLQAQRRFEEAQEMYDKALRIDPRNVIARDNLARLLYEQGRLRESLRQYHIIADLLFSMEPEELARGYGTAAPEQELIAVYRNLATIYYFLGAPDEAICYSWLAQMKAGSEEQAVQHARLLLSLGRINSALNIVRDAVIARQGNVSPQIMLDYGIALYLRGDYNLAKAALSKVLSTTTAEVGDRRTARLLLLKVALKEESQREARSLEESVREEDPRFCELKDLDPDHYWPFELHEEVQPLVATLCNSESVS